MGRSPFQRKGAPEWFKVRPQGVFWFAAPWCGLRAGLMAKSSAIKPEAGKGAPRASRGADFPTVRGMKTRPEVSTVMRGDGGPHGVREGEQR